MSSPANIQTAFTEPPAYAAFMERCLKLAALGAGFTAPNPLVGSVLVYQGKIIGEGYHEKYGGPHAEVNCLQSVAATDRRLISDSTLYVSLEPCCHYGKTPPCTNLIMREKIPRVVIGCRDPFPLVNGKGIEILTANGISVEYPISEATSKEMNRRFFTFHIKRRPYIILKWAQSANQKMAGKFGDRIKISNEYSDRLVHKWRSEEAGILVGTNTALSDNPELTPRLWPGKSPTRIVVDEKLRLPDSLKLFDGSVPTVILNGITNLKAGERLFKRIDSGQFDIPGILSAIHSLNIISVLVEGGPKLLQSFINAGAYDEIRIITNHALEIAEGLPSPDFSDATYLRSQIYGTDTIDYYRK
jgi:diaminohydroxyphosphoribosylaminopyrimidine deaminase/5-amino-6-(5-phosphoribosylamino)uracil reductase